MEKIGTLEELLEEHIKALKENTEAIRMSMARDHKKDEPPVSTDKNPTIYSQSRAARYLNVSDQTIMRWRKDGLLPFHPGDGAKIVFWKHELDALAHRKGITPIN